MHENSRVDAQEMCIVSQFQASLLLILLYMSSIWKEGCAEPQENSMAENDNEKN